MKQIPKHASNSAPIKIIPAHAELIKLWADGALIQWKEEERVGWQDCYNNLPTWSPQFKYRVKPEPKPDVVRYGVIEFNPRTDRPMIHIMGRGNVMLVFDGETGALKDAQVLTKG